MDPNGNATNGITRTQTNSASFADDDGIKSAASGGADPWPADRYLNIWTAPRVTSPVGDLLGYAQFPGGASATDGVVILHSAFGTNGTATAPFNLGRTATHEVGHWLNLFHIWGDDGSGCTGSNGPNGDLFMNYMDYVDDVAMFMVTAGQVVRMQAALDNERSTIGTTRPVLTSPRVPARAQVGVVSRSTDKLDIFVTDRNGVVFTAAWEPAFTDWWHGWWKLNVGRASLDGGVGAGVYRLVAWLVADRRMR